MEITNGTEDYLLISCLEIMSAIRVGSGMRYLQHLSTTLMAVSSDNLCPTETYTGFVASLLVFKAVPITSSVNVCYIEPIADFFQLVFDLRLVFRLYLLVGKSQIIWIFGDTYDRTVYEKTQMRG